MAKYTEETVQEIPDNEIGTELLNAQKDNIATGNPDVQLILKEISRRLHSVKSLQEERHSTLTSKHRK